MFNSLRSRLWLTYALLIGLVLCVVGTAIVLVVYRGNIPFQQAALYLQTLRSNALPKLRGAANLNPEVLQTLLDRNTEQIRGRIVILTDQGNIIADSQSEAGVGLPDFGEGPRKTEVGALPKFYRDGNGRGWYYIIDTIAENRLAFFAIHRPRLQIITIFRDQYLGPLIQAGIIALIAAFFLSLIMAKWINAPLKRISQEARQVADGDARPIPLKGPVEVRHLASSFNDMTCQVQATQHSQKDFIANVSHELKTPLTSIQGFAQAIRDGTALSEDDLHQAADVIESEAIRMNRLVEDLLTLEKMDAGSVLFKMQIFDINELLCAADLKFRSRADDAGIDLQIKHPKEEALITGDADRLMQVLDNLLDNAIKFTPRDGRISVSSQIIGKEMVIHVVDTGQGIPVSEQQRIFERFYQVDKARPGGEWRGYGLGLAISKQIVETHGGSLSVISAAGEGSHFVVKLPLQTNQLEIK